MKKVGIVTFHNSKSYGATLQAYATLEIIRKLGYDVEFVDYTNSYEQGKRKISLKHIKSFFRRMIKNIILKDSCWKRVAFNNTFELYNNALSKKINDKTDLNSLKYDILVVGSDQVWNPVITGGIDDVYLLNFSDCRKISYASSMGSHFISENEKNIYQECLSKFSKISVRETFALDELSKIINKDIKIVIDPTMLLEKDDWNKFINKQSKKLFNFQEKYILTFFVGGSTDKYKETILNVKSKLNIPVYDIHSNKYRREGIDRVLAGVSVCEFVNLIKKASFIITDSFHGTVFSILYEKPFLAVSNKNNPIRVKELLTKLSIKDRLDNINSIDQDIDYLMVNKTLKSLKMDSLKWLEGALNDER